jgi:ribonuclease R
VPRRDRLAMVVRMDLDDKGRVVAEDCAAAVIHSQGRLDYGGVAAALQGDFAGLRAAYREHARLLEDLHEVATLLRQQRLDRGSLDLDLPEAQVLLDEDDPSRIRDISESRPDNPIKRAYGLVEELMIAANEAVARMFERAEEETIWRIHPAPEMSALRRLVTWLQSYGVKARPGALRREEAMAALVNRLQEHRAARPLCYLVLRTLQQATYSVSNVGHFGLASPAYLHFTSPIRRYPDLHVHRVMKVMLRRDGKPAGNPPPVEQRSTAALDHIARDSSGHERRAIEVEREVHSVYAAALLRDRIGDESWGTVNGVGGIGAFVRLDRPFVEGLVRTDMLDRRMRFEPDLLRLVSPGDSLGLGDRVKVRVTNTSVLKRQIDLELLEREGGPRPVARSAAREEQRAGRGGKKDRSTRSGRRGKDRRTGGKRSGRGKRR